MPELSYTDRYVNALLDVYLEIVAEQQPRIKSCVVELREIMDVSSRPRREELYTVLRARYMGRESSENDAVQYNRLHETLAKMMELSRIARKHAARDIMKAHVAQGHGSADHYDTSFSVFTGYTPDNQRRVRMADMQELLTRYGHVHFSITAHPTNPTTVEFVRICVELDSLLSLPHVTREELLDCLRDFRDVPMIGEKKTVADEVQETLVVFDKIYDAVPNIHHELRDKLHAYGYDKVNLPHKIVHMSMWAAGDGDGNDNTTAAALKQAFISNQNHLITRYLFDLQSIETGMIKAHESLASLRIIRNIITYLDVNNAKNIFCNVKYMISQLQELEFLVASDNVQEAIDALKQRVYSFGCHGSMIDIRHHARDVMQTLAVLLENVGELSLQGRESVHDMFVGELPQLTDYYVNDALHNKMQRLRDHHVKSDDEAHQKVAQTIWSRLQIVAQYQHAVDKFILAEAETAEHVMAAMLLLKWAGVDMERASLDIVPLFESREDLEQAVNVMHSLMAMDVFAQYVRKRGVLKPMIAKSDTQRRSGVGIKYVQERVIADLHMLERDYGIAVSVFHGGGIELQRGGGKMTELSRVTAEGLLLKGVKQMGVPDSTIQGHQARMMFASSAGVEDYIGYSLSQQLYHGAMLKGDVDHVSPKTFCSLDEDTLDLPAIEERFFMYAVESYERHWYNNTQLIRLAELSFPWIAVKISNVSSRANMRGEKAGAVQSFMSLMGYEEGEAIQQKLKQRALNPFAQRAITFDRLMAHSGTSASFILGLQEAFLAMKKTYGSDCCVVLKSVYDQSKKLRDVVRNTAIILSLMDFDHAWALLGKERPNREERIALTTQWDDRVGDVDPEDVVCAPEVILAKIERMAHEVEREVYGMLTCQYDDKITLGRSLSTHWPELYHQMQQRALHAEFSKAEIVRLTRKIAKMGKDPIPDILLQRLRYAYIAAEVSFNTPIGVGLTQSEVQPNGQMMFAEAGLQDVLELPPVLYDGARR